MDKAVCHLSAEADGLCVPPSAWPSCFACVHIPKENTNFVLGSLFLLLSPPSLVRGYGYGREARLGTKQCCFLFFAKGFKSNRSNSTAVTLSAVKEKERRAKEKTEGHPPVIGGTEEKI